MKILLDTHILIWFLEDNKRLSSPYKDLIEDPMNVIYFSSVSIAEMAIKASKNKLKYPDSIIDICRDTGLEELTLSGKQCILLKDLPLIHHDPFDRLLVVQSQSENLYLMSQDRIFDKYDVKLVNMS